MGYKYLAITKDVIQGKIRISQLKKAMKTYDIIMRVIKLKKVKFKDLLLLKEDNIVATVNIHNRYTTGKKIPIEQIFETLRTMVNTISQRYLGTTSGGSVVSSIILSSKPELKLVLGILSALKTIGLRKEPNNG